MLGGGGSAQLLGTTIQPASSGIVVFDPLSVDLPGSGYQILAQTFPNAGAFLPATSTPFDVVVPQALRLIVPPLTNQYLNLTKNSSLAAAIAYPDLVSVFAGTVLNITGQAVEVIALTMAVYLTLSLMIAAGMNYYNKSVALRGVGS